jgi:hypothetical protein
MPTLSLLQSLEDPPPLEKIHPDRIIIVRTHVVLNKHLSAE